MHFSYQPAHLWFKQSELQTVFLVENVLFEEQSTTVQLNDLGKNKDMHDFCLMHIAPFKQNCSPKKK